MQIEKLSELLRYFEYVAQTDPGSLDRLVSITKKTAPTFLNALLYREDEKKRELAATLPPLDNITAAQLTLYDNWHATGGKKPSRKKKEPGARMQRFKAQLEVWTTTADVMLSSKSRTTKVTFDLMDRSERVERMEKYKNPTKSKGGFVIVDGKPVSPEWADYAETILTAPENTLCGPAYSTAIQGTTYVLNSLAALDARTADVLPDDMEIMVALGGGETIRFHSFDNTYAGGAPLADNAVRISRLAIDHSGWRTGLLHAPAPIEKEINEDDCPY